MGLWVGPIIHCPEAGTMLLQMPEAFEVGKKTLEEIPSTQTPKDCPIIQSQEDPCMVDIFLCISTIKINQM